MSKNFVKQPGCLPPNDRSGSNRFSWDRLLSQNQTALCWEKTAVALKRSLSGDRASVPILIQGLSIHRTPIAP
ncbi:hypothetical protein NG799_04405 [Laspinema sp. D1]|uniref:Uncharacterized protein n=1 Tax=Laspinema palackyanum D2a TaxID=2953684 RepID=A0ABT2MLE4_9CYAN|nr:hypothetical protein [Laspinema sp. D2a]